MIHVLKNWHIWRISLHVFKKIGSDRDVFIPLLLEGDEDMNMLGKYLHEGDLFGLYEDGEPVTLALVLQHEGCTELMNIVTREEKRGMGYGSAMLSFLSATCGDLKAGTGDVSPARNFYEKNGFVETGVRKDFFLQYDHPVIENGRQLVDMVIYEKRGV